MSGGSNRWFGAEVLLGCGVALAFVLWMCPSPWLNPAVRWGIFWGIALATLTAQIGYWSLCWALRKSNSVFYGIFVGGILFRLCVLGLTAFIVYGSSIDLVSILISLVVLSLVFSLIEARFLIGGTHGF